MCTVTLIPVPAAEKSFILTSNRDEAPGRKTIPPGVHTEDGIKMAYPRDAVAGGTWIGVSEHQRLICLLNGGFVDHIRDTPYRKSRGVVVKELLAVPEIDKALEEYQLEAIEPFTLIMVNWQRELQFLELVWDGKKRHISNLPLKEHIWSSTPLYNSEMRERRVTWFNKFSETSSLSSAKLWDFHHEAGDGDPEIDLIMDRGFIKTQSITQIEKNDQGTRLIYDDLSEKTITTLDLDF